MKKESGKMLNGLKNKVQAGERQKVKIQSPAAAVSRNSMPMRPMFQFEYSTQNAEGFNQFCVSNLNQLFYLFLLPRY